MYTKCIPEILWDLCNWPLSNGKRRAEQKGERRSDDGRYGERGARTALHIARVATLIGMPMGSYLLGSRTRAQDSTLPLEGLDAVASLTTPAVGFQPGKK